MYVKNTSTKPSLESNYYPAWVTLKPINISKYTKIVAEGEFITPTGTLNRIIITTNSSNYNSVTYKEKSIGENATRIELELTDIDANLKKAYVALACQNSNYNEHTEITIRKVWLEK